MATEKTTTEGRPVPISNEVLHNEMQHLARTLEDIKTTLQAFPRIDRVLGEEIVRNEHSRRDITLLWERFDQGKLQRDVLAQEIDKTRNEFAEVVNKGKGAMWVLGISIGFFQAIIMAAMGWVFTNVSASNTSVKLVEQRVQVMQDQINLRKP